MKKMIEGIIVDVVKKMIFKGSLTIENGKISKIESKEDVPNQYIIPGFVDAHIHVESSMLIPSEFARLAVCHGTVATVSDPHEIANVLGKEGVKFMIENGKKVPFKFYFGAPSCVPATVFETAGATISAKDIEEILSWENVNYLAEMMNFPGVLERNPEVMEKINIALKMNKKVDGHAPGLRGNDAKKYIEAGISTDHECFTKEEALDKLKYGMKISIREGSAAKNFEALWTLIDEFPDEVMLCSDDKHPNDLVLGHINLLAKRAIEKGCDLMNVLRACSYNPIKHYNMNVGLLQENDPADFCVVQDLVNFEVIETFIDGNLVSVKNKATFNRVEEKAINCFDCNEIQINQIQIENQRKPFQVIVVEDGQLITKKQVFENKSVANYLDSDLERDLLKIVVVNRYFDAPPAVGFVKNFGLKNGAIASNVAHDSHNIIAVGTNDEDICAAINQIIENKGGVSLADKSYRELVKLTTAGIMSTEDAYVVADQYDKIEKSAKKLGSKLSSPFMTLSFCALLVIPELKMSDKGLFDGNEFAFKDLWV
jgi:adenine deaminase